MQIGNTNSLSFKRVYIRRDTKTTLRNINQKEAKKAFNELLLQNENHFIDMYIQKRRGLFKKNLKIELKHFETDDVITNISQGFRETTGEFIIRACNKANKISTNIKKTLFEI